MRPHYRSQRPLDATLLKAQAGTDAFITEKYADQLGEILQHWSASLMGAPREVGAIEKNLTTTFAGASLQAAESRTVRIAPAIEVRSNQFPSEPTLNREGFLRTWQACFSSFSSIDIAELQITRLNVSGNNPLRLSTRIRYEIAGSGEGFDREQRVGNWEVEWQASDAGEFKITTWHALDQAQARSTSAIFSDVTAAVLGRNGS